MALTCANSSNAYSIWAAFTSYWYVDAANYLPAWRMKGKMGETRALQTECLCPSKMYMLKSVFQYDGVWEVIRS